MQRMMGRMMVRQGCTCRFCDDERKVQRVAGGLREVSGGSLLVQARIAAVRGDARRASKACFTPKLDVSASVRAQDSSTCGP